MLKFIDASMRIDFTRLEKRNAPSVSLYMPTHRGSSEKEQDMLTYKNLLLQAEKSLQESYGKREYEKVLSSLQALLDDPSEQIWRSSKEALAVLADPEDTYVFRLEYPVEQRAIVADSFHIKPLVRNYQYGSSYYVLALSKSRFDLYHGNFYCLEKVELPEGIENEFTMVYPDRDDDSNVNAGSYGGLQASYHGHRSSSEVSEKETGKFFRYVNDEVEKLLAEVKDTPVILASLTQHQAEFRALSSLPNLLEQGVEKGIDSLTEEDLFEEAKALITEEQKSHIIQLVGRYQQAQAAEKASSDIRTIANALVERKVETLFIEEGVTIPGSFDAVSGSVSFEEIDKPAIDDITDDFAQRAYSQGAAVYVLSPEKMPVGTEVAALFRY